MSKSIIHLIVDSGPKQGETLDRKPGSVIRIGRVVKGNTLAIKDPSVSQKHIVIEFDTQRACWALRDLDSANGTFVNGERVPSSSAVHLSDGDAIRIGGECSSISVKISVIEGNVEGIKGNGVKKGRDKSKKAGDCREDDRNLMKDEIVDSGVESRVEEVAKRGRKRRNDEDLTKEEKLGSTADDGTEAKDLGRGRRKNPTIGSQENKILGTGSEDRIETLKSLGRSGKADDCVQIKDQNRGRLLTKDENSDSVVQDETKESPKHLVKGRTRKSTRGSNKTDELQKLERGEERNSSTTTSRKDEIFPKGGDDRMKALEKLGRGRKRRSTIISPTDGVVNNTVNVPKILTRRTRASLGQVLEKDPCLTFKTQIGESFASDLIHKKSLPPAVETFIDEPKNLRRGRSRNLNPTPKEDEILEDSIRLPKATGVGRRTRSTKACTLDLVNEDMFQAPKNVGSRRRTSSVQFSKLDETLDSVMEDGTEATKNLRRGKRTTNSSKVSKTDVVSDVVMENAVEGAKNVGRGKPIRAPARRTRASSRGSEDENPLHPAQSNLKDIVLKPLENLYQAKKPRDGSKLLYQSDKINQTPQIPSSPDLNVKRSPVREDKDNNVLVKSQKTDSESTTTRNSSYERNSDEVMPLSGRVNKPSHVLPKAWNGNGIPNTTTKYKEDSKVSWHDTPFEERLDKALSGDRFFPQRKVTN